jgi:hypothetical protein
MWGLIVTYSISLSGRWHAGSGLGRGTADRAVLRDIAGAPYVPGSHIKGLLRDRCERLATSLGFPVDDPHIEDPTSAQRFGPLAGSNRVVDRLFGTRYQGDVLFVDDACVPEGAWPDRMNVTRVSMSRAFGRAAHQRLFESEYALEGALDGCLQCAHPPEQVTTLNVAGQARWPMEWGLLVAALQTLDALGGDRSTGAGQCEVSIGAMRARRNVGPWKEVSFEDLIEPWVQAHGPGVLHFFEAARRDHGPGRLEKLCETARTLDLQPDEVFDPAAWAAVEDLMPSSGEG